MSAAKLPMYVNPGHCGPCGGMCCKTLPGTSSPEDFGAPDEAAMLERITAALVSGRWSLDWWEESPVNVFFPRPAVEGGEGDLLYPEDLGSFWWAPAQLGCTFLTSTGCELAYEARPLECRALEPRPGGRGCVPHAGAKGERANEWRPYQALVAAARAHVEAAQDSGESREEKR